MDSFFYRFKYKNRISIIWSLDVEYPKSRKRWLFFVSIIGFMVDAITIRTLPIISVWFRWLFHAEKKNFFFGFYNVVHVISYRFSASLRFPLTLLSYFHDSFDFLRCTFSNSYFMNKINVKWRRKKKWVNISFHVRDWLTMWKWWW